MTAVRTAGIVYSSGGNNDDHGRATPDRAGDGSSGGAGEEVGAQMKRHTFLTHVGDELVGECRLLVEYDESGTITDSWLDGICNRYADCEDGFCYC